MSAWIVSKRHIDFILTGHRHGTRDGVYKGRGPDGGSFTADGAGQRLWNENFDSINHAYPSDTPEEYEAYTFEPTPILPSVAELYQAVVCLDYQSCEHPGYSTSYACGFLTAMREEIEQAHKPAGDYKAAQDAGAGSVVLTRTWPELDAAPWGLDDDRIAALIVKYFPETAQAVADAVHTASVEVHGGEG